MKGHYAFIDFADAKDAVIAIEKMHKTMLNGNELCVEATRKCSKRSFC
jgi:RNA recognition motif-containing protein